MFHLEAQILYPSKYKKRSPITTLRSFLEPCPNRHSKHIFVRHNITLAVQQMSLTAGLFLNLCTFNQAFLSMSFPVNCFQVSAFPSKIEQSTVCIYVWEHTFISARSYLVGFRPLRKVRHLLSFCTVILLYNRQTIFYLTEVFTAASPESLLKLKCPS